jgi:hypothetical protein
MCKHLLAAAPCNYRKGCKTPLFLPSCLPVGLISNVPFVFLLPGTHFWVPLYQVQEKVSYQECLRSNDSSSQSPLQNSVIIREETTMKCQLYVTLHFSFMYSSLNRFILCSFKGNVLSE